MTHDPLDWLLGLEHLGMKFGLENMTRLSAALDRPQDRFPSIHVAGTNGKGSVTAMVDTALLAAGYRSARYTSPHLERLEERYVVDGAEIGTEALRAAVGAVRDAVDRVRAEQADFMPTFFECATAAAFLLFADARVDVAVLEVGLGGRLDATNVVQPLVTAITSIDFDHQALLGDDLAAIAAEKAGIIKAGVPVIVGPLPPAADATVRRIAAERQAPVVNGNTTWEGRFAGVRPALRGPHQKGNIGVAVAILDALSDRGLHVSDAAIRDGLERVRWPGRLELLPTAHGDVLLDAAHNPAGARALAAFLDESAWTDAALVFGAMGDKDLRGMLTALAPAVAAIVCTTAPGARAADADRLAALARDVGFRHVEREADPGRAVARARALSRRVVVSGSIFLIGALRGILR